MSKTFVIGDIHGGLRALFQIFERAKVKPEDKIIFLGDYVDGWSESPQVLDFLIELGQNQECVFMKGNHDDLLQDWLQHNTENIDIPMWYTHGGEATVSAYENVTETNKLKHISFLKSLQDYHLDSKNRLFIHAGFTNIKGIEYEYFPKLFYWDRTLWETALSLNDKLQKDHLFYPKRLSLYKEIYIGHTPVTKIGESIPINKSCIWNMDTGAAFKGRLSIMNIETKEYWQSDPLPLLYPNEKGRIS